MFKREGNTKGFTMVELLVVLIIVGILAAVATPLYLTNVQRARASEAVGTMGLIRQAMRDYRISTNTYFDVAAATDVGNIQNALPTSVVLATGVPTPATAGLAIPVEVRPYFSNGSYTVDAVLAADEDGESLLFVNPPAVDFIIRASGNSAAVVAPYGRNRACTAAIVTNCSTKATEAANYRLEMDNSGRTFVSYEAGAAGTWSAY